VIGARDPAGGGQELDAHILRQAGEQPAVAGERAEDLEARAQLIGIYHRDGNVS
jgi:hypothetical protein